MLAVPAVVRREAYISKITQTQENEKISPVCKNTFPSKIKFGIGRLLSHIYVIYYFTYGLYPGFVMLVYFTWIEAAYYYIHDNIPRKYFLAFCMFALGWTMQFIGHAIEGRKPALFDSLSQAFTAAPLFSIQAFLPDF